MDTSALQHFVVPPEALAYVESRGMSPQQKLTPGPHGEIGTYQLTPPAYADLQRLNPDYKNKDFFSVASNDSTAKQAMLDYLFQLGDNYNIPTNADDLIQAYNVSPTAYKKGKRNPAYVKTYHLGLSK